MRYNTIDLTDARLHYAVACMLGAEFKPNTIGAQHAYVGGKYIGGFVTKTTTGVSMPHDVFAPSKLVAYGGAVGERILGEHVHSLLRTAEGWCAVTTGATKAIAHGETMRVAGLRAAVLGELGETIDIPDWLE